MTVGRTCLDPLFLRPLAETSQPSITRKVLVAESQGAHGRTSSGGLGAVDPFPAAGADSAVAGVARLAESGANAGGGSDSADAPHIAEVLLPAS